MLDKTKNVGKPQITWTNARISALSRKQHEQVRDNIPYYMNYPYICKIANSSIESHRSEVYIASALQMLGINAHAISCKADGNTSTKAVDITIESADGTVYALEVKRAYSRGTSVGLPVDDFIAGANGFERLPKQLYVDSIKAWRAKANVCKRERQVLLGAIVLCCVDEWSDEDEPVFGAVYLPNNLSDLWGKKLAYNQYKGTEYMAYYCKQPEMQTLADLVQELHDAGYQTPKPQKANATLMKALAQASKQPTDIEQPEILTLFANGKCTKANQMDRG